MRILDLNGLELEHADMDAGRLQQERILLQHHEAVAAVEEQGHYETVQEYENGGKDVAWVVDMPGREAQAAWDEYEDILRFIPFTRAELAARGIETRRANLAQTDYIAAKAMDALMGCKSAAEALSALAGIRGIYADMLAQRQRWRDEIAALEREVADECV